MKNLIVLRSYLLIGIIGLLLSFNLMATDIVPSDVKITRAQIKQVLKEFNKQGKISDAQLKQAMKELDGMDEKRLELLISQGKLLGKKMAKEHDKKKE